MVDIYRQEDIDSIVNNGVINDSIVIRGTHIPTLQGVCKINGDCGICDSTIHSLGNLLEVTGDFWISYSPKITSLSNITAIYGNCNLSNSNIHDITTLVYVGGDFNIKNTNIDSIENILYIGGNLHLPYQFKDYNIVRGNTSVNVGGKIKYWHISQKEKLNEGCNVTIKSEIAVPYWEHEYIYSETDILPQNKTIKDFYKYYKNSFLQGKYINIECNDNYAFVLMYDLLNLYKSHRDINVLHEQYNALGQYYPKTKSYCLIILIEEYNKIEYFDKAWDIIQNQYYYIDITTIREYSIKCNRDIITPDLIAKLGKQCYLTSFGVRNINSIYNFVGQATKNFEHKHNNQSFIDIFFDKNKLYKAKDGQIDIEYYRQFFTKGEDLIEDLESSKQQIQYNYIPSIVRRAVADVCSQILRDAEDLYRVSIGMPKIGEGWINETNLFHKIAESFNTYKVIQHGKPKWLGKQHIDIFFPELNIGIEYQGLQHYKPVSIFGGNEGFKASQKRDMIKLALCKANNCTLIYVNEGYSFNDVVAQIQHAIKIKTKE